MSNNSGRISQRRTQRRKLGMIWWEIVWPALIVTCIGLAGILFLVFCARVSLLELEVGNLNSRIDERMATQHRLGQRIAQLSDRAHLRQFAQDSGMVFEPAATDVVQLPGLPAPQRSIPTLAAQREPLLSRARPARPEQLTVAHRTVVADAF